MTEHETLTTAIKAAVSRLQPHEVEALAAHLEQVGFRKTVELGELERWEYDWPKTGECKTLHRATGTPDDDDLILLSDVRRLAAPKEREWIPVTSGLPVGKFLVPYGDSVEVCDSALGFITLANNPHLADQGWDGTFAEARADWGGRPVRFSVYQALPPPPTNPAQTAKEGV